MNVKSLSIFLAYLFLFSMPVLVTATAPPPDCGQCCYWSSTLKKCVSRETCGNCCNCVECSCVAKTPDPCPEKSCYSCGENCWCKYDCNPADCQTCDNAGSCVVCGGDPNLKCCGRGKCCDKSQCFKCGETPGTCEYQCDTNCEFCCDGTCCKNWQCCIDGECIDPICDNCHTVSIPTLYECQHYPYDTECSTTECIENVMHTITTCDYKGYDWPCPKSRCDNMTVSPWEPAFVQIVHRSPCPGGVIDYVFWYEYNWGCGSEVCNLLTWEKSCETSSCTYDPIPGRGGPRGSKTECGGCGYICGD